MSSRRGFLKYSAALATAASPLASAFADSLTIPSGNPAELARDEAFWQTVSKQYDIQSEIINLEQGYWGKMANPVQQAFFEHTRRVNREMSWYARKHFGQDLHAAREAVATHPCKQSTRTGDARQTDHRNGHCATMLR